MKVPSSCFKGFQSAVGLLKKLLHVDHGIISWLRNGQTQVLFDGTNGGGDAWERHISIRLPHPSDKERRNGNATSFIAGVNLQLQGS
jgi:hypothetical protein